MERNTRSATFQHQQLSYTKLELTNDRLTTSVLFRSISFYFVIFCSMLFYFVLFHSISFYSVLFRSISFYFVLFRSILFYFVLFHSIPFYLILFRHIPFYFVLFRSIPFYSVLFCSISFYFVLFRSISFYFVPLVTDGNMLFGSPSKNYRYTRTKTRLIHHAKTTVLLHTETRCFMLAIGFKTCCIVRFFRY